MTINNKNGVLHISLSLFILFFLSAGYAQHGQLITKNIPAHSLKNNLIGVADSQFIAIYLPPSYISSGKNYPVLYFLHGFGDRVQYWLNGTYQNFKFNESMDNLISKGIIKEFIVVIPNGYNFMGGSFYVNSPVTGNCEDFIVKDVIDYIDKNYRTVPKPESRGISGHSMGGFSALNLAMHHPDLFGYVYSLSPGLFDSSGLKNCQLFKNQSFINQFISKEEEYSKMSGQDALTDFKSYIQGRFNSGDWDTPFAYAYGAAFSPDTNKPLPFTDYPYFKQGEQIIADSFILKNYENGYGGLLEKVTTFKNNLLKLRAITIDYGNNDNYKWIPQGCRYFSDLLTTEGIKNDLVTFNGGHEDQVRKRIEAYLLPFFSGKLEYDTTSTGLNHINSSPVEFNLYQNHPNPFNPETVISYQIPFAARVELKVYNILGKEIASLIDEVQRAGNHKVKFTGNNLPSGIYIYKLQACNYLNTKKMTLLK